MRNTEKLLLTFKQLKQSSRITIGKRVGFTSLSATNKTNNNLTLNCTNNKALFTYQEGLELVVAKVHTSHVGSREIGYSEYQELSWYGVTVIDVRERYEIEQTGTIPGSLHIPLNQIDYALAMTADDFQSKYGRRKPGEGEVVIFLCQRGFRSRTAMEKAVQMGYYQALSYRGGWEDYERNSMR